jgi:GNAT superfamily N-acetyltransferase
MHSISLCFLLFSLMEIRKLSPQDIPLIKDLTPDDWSDITPYFQFYLNLDNCQTFLFLEAENIIGTGNINYSADLAWLSHIIVLPAYRGNGVGSRITEFLLAETRKHRCSQVILAATAMGEPIYKKSGFVPVCKYLFFKSGSLNLQSSMEIQDLLPEDQKQVLEMDLSVTGEDRSYLFKNAFKGHVIKTGSKILGYYLPEVWDGPVIASDSKAGLALLNLKLQQKGFVVLPENNKVAVNALLESGAEEFHAPVTRMILHPPFSWFPENIYGRIAGAFG